VTADLAVEADQLVKVLGKHRAVDGVSFEVPRGAVFGLLGPNGSGKTTVVRLLTTLLRPTSGSARVDGIDVARDPGLVRARIGLTGQYAAVEERLTPTENLNLIGRLYHLPKREIAQRSAELLSRFELEAAARRPVREFSGGMRRRLDIAMSLIARPSVLFLDEPTTGLDPRSRLAMWELIEELGEEGTTVLLTTQYLDEVDRLAEQIIVIDTGRVIAKGTADELKNEIGGDHLSVSIARPENGARAIEALQPLCSTEVVADDEGLVLSASIHTGDRLIPRAIRALDDAGVDVLSVEMWRPTLDDVFLELTGRPLAPDDGEADRSVGTR
jgi:ABC-2 type transport system ATP-binding protein